MDHPDVPTTRHCSTAGLAPQINAAALTVGLTRCDPWPERSLRAAAPIGRDGLGSRARRIRRSWSLGRPRYTAEGSGSKMRSHAHIVAFAALAAACAFLAAPAQAAPQVLGLVASNGHATPLRCDDSGCSALLSSFCLQQVRPGPSSGSAYRIAEGGAVTLVARTADGGTLRLPAGDYLQLSTRIGFTSVRATLPKAAREALGIVGASVEVGPLVSIVPVEAAGDTAPQTREEVALATGAVRKAAEASFEAPGAPSDAARVASAMINALPELTSERVPDDATLWAEAVTPDLAATVTSGGTAMARQMLHGCRIAVASHTIPSLRSCLELQHADLMAHRNQQFWQSLGGS
jgi:hypothetical protein